MGCRPGLSVTRFLELCKRLGPPAPLCGPHGAPTPCHPAPSLPALSSLQVQALRPLWGSDCTPLAFTSRTLPAGFRI